MKKILSAILCTTCCMQAAFAQQPMWLDERKSEENRLPMHASYYVYESEGPAHKNKS